MTPRRWMLSRTLMGMGSFCLVLGILLLLIKLLMTVAWYAAGAIALTGVLLVGVGTLIGGYRVRR